jgi:hypothetical protein
MSTTLPLIPIETDIKIVSLEATILRLENLINTRVVDPDLAVKCAALASSLRREVRILKMTTPSTHELIPA